MVNHPRFMLLLGAALLLAALGMLILEKQSYRDTNTVSMLQELSECCEARSKQTNAATALCEPIAAKTAPTSPIVLPPRVELPSEVDLLRNKLLQRLREFKRFHLDNNRPHVVGMRGVSWIHANLNGALIASPGLAEALNNPDKNGVVTIKFVDVSLEQRCPADMANLVSIYVRLSGPELIAVVAQPIAGKCEWEAKFQVSIAGAYTVLARLLHYNGGMDVTDDCEIVENWENAASLVLLHSIPRYPYFPTDGDCRKMCTRFEHCMYSIDFRHMDNDVCHLLAVEPHEGRNGKYLLDIINEAPEAEHLELCKKQRPFAKHEWIWQLGCGRDEMLLRWAPCAGLVNAGGRRLRGVEDMILFEFENSNLPIPLSNAAIPNELITSLDASQRVFDEPTLPVCSASQLAKWMPFGRWTRTPPERLARCGPLPHFDISNGQTSPTDLHATDPICNLRFPLDMLNQDHQPVGAFRWELSRDYWEVWKTELSDSYFRTRRVADNHGELWTGYFRLPPQAPCAIASPSMFTPPQIRRCIVDQNLEFYLTGDSIMEFFTHHFTPLLRLAFPEITFAMDKRNTWITFPGAAAAAGKRGGLPKKRVFFSNFNVPNYMTFEEMPGLRELFAGEGVREDYNGKADVKLFMTPPFTIWERRNGLTALRTTQVSQLMRDVLLPKGWREIDFNRLSREWTMDATSERDSLHVIGHSMVTAVQLFFQAACHQD